MFNLRYYQNEMIEAVNAQWEKVQSTALISATGTGKTEVYLALAASAPGRVLVMVHRDYLISQPIARLAQLGFDDVSVEKALQSSEGLFYKAKVVFGSVQSLCKPERLATFDPHDFSMLVIDEGHRAVAATYRRVIEHFKTNPRLRILILTATPKRRDNIALGNVCESVAYTYTPKRAANEGWIVPLKFFRRDVQGLDFSHVNLKGSDLNQEQVQQLLMQEEPLHRVCASLAEDRGPTIIFCPGVDVARAYATLMDSRYRPGRATCLWADSPDDERELAAKRMEQGELDYIFNVDLFTEGYDVPDLARVVWAAPTASLVRFMQGTGRVFRPHASVKTKLCGSRNEAPQRRLLIAQSPKPFGEVVTYYPQNCKHQLCEPNDILGGDDLPPEVRNAAKKIQEATAAQASGSDPEEDIETAKAFVSLRALLEKRRRCITAEAEVNDVEYDAMGGSTNRYSAESSQGARKAAKAISNDWPHGKPASPAMLGWLKHHGIPNSFDLEITAWRGHVLRELIESNVSPETALSYGKNQALAVLNKMKATVVE